MALRAILIHFCFAAVAAASSRTLRGAAHGPNLPPVAKIMNESSQTLDRVSRQLSELGSRAADAARAQRAQLAQLKSGYEQRLGAEQATNDNLQSQSKALSAKIWELERGNHKLRDQAHGLQTENSKLRQALDTASAKADAAESFVNTTLRATDDSHAAYLDVLVTKRTGGSADDSDAEGSGASTSADTDSDDTNQDANSDDDSDGATGESLLEVRRHLSRRHTVDADSQESDQEEEDDQEETESDSESGDDDASDAPAPAPAAQEADLQSSNLIGSLQTELKQLAAQQASSSQQMDKLFHQRLRKITDQRTKILKDQKALNHTCATLEKEQSELKVAVHHLEATKGKLSTKMQGLGQYLQTLASFVLKPSAQAEKLIPSLPDDVASFLETRSVPRHREQ